MATLGAASALRLDHEAGSLDAGKRADFLVVKASRQGEPEEIARAVIEESQIEEIYLAGKTYGYQELAGCPPGFLL